jgi:TFIIF-interacting CTD phosphatase-like protein
MSEMGELHLFTASTKAYADPIIDAIDPHGYITGRFYRDNCQIINGKYIKQMEVVTKNLAKLIIIDDSESPLYKGMYSLVSIVL